MQQQLSDEQYMRRCLHLAINGLGFTSPNPMVGALIVHDGKIIGEGYHRQYGEPHAEVNAIASVKDKSLLKDSIIYVSLEPCSHFGKTPPCADLLVQHGFKKVVVACVDPYSQVSGRGIEKIRAAGIETVVGVLEDEAKDLNKEFFLSHQLHRPYIYLKWAQSADNFIDKVRSFASDEKPALISNEFTQILTHKLRAEVDSILVGTNTAIKDNPTLTTRYWFGKNPVRVTIDNHERIPHTHHLFDGNVETIVITEKQENKEDNIFYFYIDPAHDFHEALMNFLHQKNINSILIEGGSLLLQSFINHNLWDEAYIEVSDKILMNGVKIPAINGMLLDQMVYNNSVIRHLSRS